MWNLILTIFEGEHRCLRQTDCNLTGISVLEGYHLIFVLGSVELVLFSVSKLLPLHIHIGGTC